MGSVKSVTSYINTSPFMLHNLTLIYSVSLCFISKKYTVCNQSGVFSEWPGDVRYTDSFFSSPWLLNTKETTRFSTLEWDNFRLGDWNALIMTHSKQVSGKQESIWATGSIRQDGEFSVQSISCLWECASVCVWVRVLVGNQCARTLLTQITSFETKVNGRDRGLKPVWKSKVR